MLQIAKKISRPELYPKSSSTCTSLESNQLQHLHILRCSMDAGLLDLVSLLEFHLELHTTKAASHSKHSTHNTCEADKDYPSVLCGVIDNGLSRPFPPTLLIVIIVLKVHFRAIGTDFRTNRVNSLTT